MPMSEFAALRRHADRLLADYRHARFCVAADRAAVQTTRQTLADVTEARTVVQAVAKSVQQAVHDRVAGVVTRCLMAVFGEAGYEFRIVFETKRGKTDARFVFVRDGKEFDPRDGVGGGVLDLAAFALRLTAIVVKRPRRRRLLVCDEPFKHLSVKYRPAARELLEALADEMDFQVIQITHSEELACGKIIRL